MTLTAEQLAALKSASRKREATFDASTINVADRTCVVAFASETPARQYIGIGNIDVAWETLSLTPGACNLERLNSGAPLLFNHNRDQHIGVIVKAWVDADKVGRALVKFSESALGEEKWKDVQAGILTKVSVGYIDCAYVLTGTNPEDRLPMLRAESWLPIEISLVTIPADNSVGVGRSLPADTASTNETISPEPTPAAAAAPVPDARAINSTDTGTENKTRNMNRKEINQKIRNLADKYAKLVKDEAKLRSFANSAIDSGEQTDADVQAFINDNIAERSADTSTVTVTTRSKSTMSPVIASIRSGGNFSGKVQFRAASIDGSAGKGGEFVGVQIAPATMALQNASAFLKNGAQLHTGLTESLSLGSWTGATATWAAKGDAVGTSAPLSKAKVLTPKRVGLTFTVDKAFLAQDPNAEAELEEITLRALAQALDKAALEGAGTAVEPEGITAADDVNEITFGLAGITYDKVTEAVGKVSGKEGDESHIWVISPGTKGVAMSTQMAAGLGFIYAADGSIAGRKAITTGLLSESNKVVYGPAKNVHFGIFGQEYELIVDMSKRAEYGEAVVTATMLADVGFVQPEAFVRSTNSGVSN